MQLLPVLSELPLPLTGTETPCPSTPQSSLGLSELPLPLTGTETLQLVPHTGHSPTCPNYLYPSRGRKLSVMILTLEGSVSELPLPLTGTETTVIVKILYHLSHVRITSTPHGDGNLITPIAVVGNEDVRITSTPHGDGNNL